MNLGQLIGEIHMLVEHGIGPSALRLAVPEPAPRPRTMVCADRQGQVLELLETHPRLNAGSLRRLLGVSVSNASVILYTMHNNGKLQRHGEHGSYEYTRADS